MKFYLAVPHVWCQSWHQPVASQSLGAFCSFVFCDARYDYEQWVALTNSVQALENNGTIQSVPVLHVKVRKGQRFRRPEKNIRCLAPFFRI